MSPESAALAERLRAICLSFEGATEKLSHGSPAFFVGGRLFATYDDYHHGAKHAATWLAAPPGAQEMLIAADPERYFRPPYVGHRGWVAVVLDTEPDWDDVAGLIADAVEFVRPVRKTRRAKQSKPGSGA